MYERYGKNVAPSVWGASHAKVMYMYPYLIMGSANWSVSSEANKELSLVLEIEDQTTRSYVEDKLYEMQSGAVERYYPAISGESHGTRPRERAAG